MLPPFPSWDAAHPALVHLPIGLTLTAWVPFVIGLVAKHRRVWWASALVMLVMATMTAFLAVWSGEAGEDAAKGMGVVVERAVHEHEETAESARTLILIATALLGALVAASWRADRKSERTRKRRPVVFLLAVLFLAVYGVACARLAWAGHQGGELVHIHGVRAPMGYPQPDE